MTRAVESTTGLWWGINRRFLAYVSRMSDGQCSATDGASVVDSDVFHFEADPQAGGELRFRGDVRFSGHHGFLFVRIADPWLLVEGDVATLTVAPLPGESERRPLVTLTLRAASDHVTDLAGTDVRLTAEGAALFGGAYIAGEAFDDLTVRLPVEEDR